MFSHSVCYMNSTVKYTGLSIIRYKAQQHIFLTEMYLLKKQQHFLQIIETLCC